MPTFDDSTTTSAPVEEVWKLLYDPARFPDWWAGVETVEGHGRDGEGDITVYPDGYPDFPMLQQLRADGDGKRLTISCLISYLVFEWRRRRSIPARGSRPMSRSPRRRRHGWSPSAAQ